MALPPTIPTSFVPKQAVSAPKRRTSGANPFLALAYLILAIAIVAALAVFGYQYYLENVAKQKAADVVTAQNQIDQATVTEFIRLRDRFAAAKSILNQQIALSQFFDVLENLTLANVRFNSLKVTVGSDRVAHVEMTGAASSFNALAAESNAFASEKRIKRAIFSNISVATTGGVLFDLTADVDPSLVVRSVASASVPVAAATTATSSATSTSSAPMIPASSAAAPPAPTKP